MMKLSLYLVTIALLCTPAGFAQQPPSVKTANGVLEGTREVSGVRSFKGIPFAQPPVGQLRFRAPEPPVDWKGVRKAVQFGPRAMQLPLYSDMQFRSNGVSEDCLYLNVWAPATGTRLPVLVYFYGGGFVCGDGSEYRYDGESLATRGCVTVTVNYRLGVFGFLAHPELTKESPNHASGNYGLMDQHAALVWVQKNIAAFGGDPTHVTIAGESAGSYSVSAQMASPLSKGLFAAAIGESGSLLANRTATLADAEKIGSSFAAGLGNKSLADLRGMTADELLQATAKAEKFPVDVDGYFFSESPTAIFTSGKQMRVPLLAGWNSAEVNYTALLGKDEPTVENYEKAVRKAYGDKADAVLAVYKVAKADEVRQVATDLATDRFIAFGTWRWIDVHSKTGGKKVYRYIYAHPRPPAVSGEQGGPVMGAGHSWEIEYALGNLKTNKVYAWTAQDDAVSATMESYFEHFIKTYDPNGGGLPVWKAVPGGYMRIDVQTEGRAVPDVEGERYRVLNELVK
jgi:para-nitrobenzyl esterase